VINTHWWAAFERSIPFQRASFVPVAEPPFGFYPTRTFEAYHQPPMKHFLPITALALLLGACEQDPTQSEQYKGLADQKFQTEVALAAKDSSLNAMFESFNRINENMRTIKEKQGMLDDTTPGAEPSDDMEQRMASDLARIDELLAQNRDLISKLRKDAKANTGAIAALQKTLDEMERTVAEKDSEISGLKEQLLSANSSLATLMEMYRDKEQQATMQRDELNKAFYVIGTAKELTEKGILTKEGGVVGIGAVKKLNTAGLSTELFKQVDITQTLEIPLMVKKAKLVSTHPNGSYKLEGEVDKLVISDPNAFWSASKYLVIVVD